MVLSWLARGLVIGVLSSACNTRGDPGTVPPREPEPREGESQRPAARGRITDLADRVAEGAPAPACGPMLLTRTGAEHLRRRPYLQNVSATEAFVLFSTVEPQKPVVIELSGADGSRIVPTLADPADPTGRQRFARLSGLRSGTSYCYQLADWTQPIRFRTAPPAHGPGPVRFIAFGDSGGDSRERVRRQLALYSFDLLLHVGDISYPSSTLANLEVKFFDTYAGLLSNAPIFPASGNHEYWADGAAPFRQVFALPENGGPSGGERWYSFDWGPVHFVALDTERVGAEQAQWLDRDLEQSALPWTIVYMHRPPFSSGSHGGAADVRDTFTPLFEKHAVPLVLSGHDHDYERTHPIRGVTYVVTGGGGYNVRPVGSSDFTARSLSIFHFVRAEVTEQAILLQAIDTEGGAFDSVSIPQRTTGRAPQSAPDLRVTGSSPR